MNDFVEPVFISNFKEGFSMATNGKSLLLFEILNSIISIGFKVGICENFDHLELYIERYWKLRLNFEDHHNFQ